MSDSRAFGDRRSYYNNFAAHLLNAYNPNMLYPELPHRWSDGDWCDLIDMVASFGFNAFQFWLVPRFFCRQGLQEPYGQAFIRQMRHVIECAHSRGLQVDMLCSLATVGSDWHTYCPNVEDEWTELVFLWDAWTRTLPGVDIVSIFPGDPGACSRNGCTALTYIDKASEIAALVKRNLPSAEITLHTWGPPFFGWGNIVGPASWQGEFLQEVQHTAWAFDRARADRAMNHLLERLPDFPDPTSVAINLGFNPDGRPEGEANAIPWANEVAKTHRIQTWDFSLTEGENAIVPHYRFQRLFEQRRRERAAAPYSGGICFTMTPLLNQLSLYLSAQSFIDPDADYQRLAAGFYERLFGPAGRELVSFLPLFEVVPDWGNYSRIETSRQAYHRAMRRLLACLHDLSTAVRPDLPFYPSVESYRQELLFFAELFAGLSGPAPDYDALRRRYWNRVYAIYALLPDHVDPRPQRATDNLIRWFARWD
jgi:hypothetical protein